MEKPEKRTGYTKIRINDVLRALAFTVGWNDACDEWEDYHNFKMKEAKDRLPTEENIEEIITTYFVLEKRWLRCKGRTILFDENDSKYLAEIISKQIRGGVR